jgi:hypothetical protein
MIKSRRKGQAQHVTCMGWKTHVQKILMRKLKGKKPPLRRPRHSWVDNIKMNLKETGSEDVDRFYVAKGRDQ